MATKTESDAPDGRIPRPGTAVRGSRSGAPIMALFDLLGRRWAMGVLWTTCEVGPATFRELQQRCETISAAVLNQRIKDLQAARLLTRSTEGYVATELGRQVYEDLTPLSRTAKTWAKVLDEA